MCTRDSACAPEERRGALRACDGRIALDGAVNCEVGAVSYGRVDDEQPTLVDDARVAFALSYGPALRCPSFSRTVIASSTIDSALSPSFEASSSALFAGMESADSPSAQALIKGQLALMPNPPAQHTFAAPASPLSRGRYRARLPRRGL